MKPLPKQTITFPNVKYLLSSHHRVERSCLGRRQEKKKRKKNSVAPILLPYKSLQDPRITRQRCQNNYNQTCCIFTDVSDVPSMLTISNAVNPQNAHTGTGAAQGRGRGQEMSCSKGLSRS